MWKFLTLSFLFRFHSIYIIGIEQQVEMMYDPLKLALLIIMIISIFAAYLEI